MFIKKFVIGLCLLISTIFTADVAAVQPTQTQVSQQWSEEQREMFYDFLYFEKPFYSTSHEKMRHRLGMSQKINCMREYYEEHYSFEEFNHIFDIKGRNITVPNVFHNMSQDILEEFMKQTVTCKKQTFEQKINII